MKVSELTGALLDYWVAKAEGATHVEIAKQSDPDMLCCFVGIAPYNPSSSWGIGGPIIDRDGIQTLRRIETPSPVWDASLARGACALEWFAGPTPLIAAMRAYVASKYGEEVSG